MFKTVSLAASVLLTLAVVVGFSTPVVAVRPGAAAVALSQPLPPAVPGCCLLA